MVVLTPPDLGAHVGFQFPTMHAARRVFAPGEVPRVPVPEIPAAVQVQLAGLSQRIQPGTRVGITAGSRGIANIPAILRACGEAVRDAGGVPFILPAMGSHGGGTAAGQVEVLAGYGITSASMAMPIDSSMEVREISRLDNGMPVYLAESALNADHILLVNRVKLHTDFRGRVESGLAKICAIGLGKQAGAQTVHGYGSPGLADLMPRTARTIIERTGKVLGGLAVLENAHDETASVHWVEPEDVAGPGEEALLHRSRELMARLPFYQLDVLIVDEMGKNVSGCGMDTNVIGRMFVPGVAEDPSPRITAIVVLDLTDESHGNATGVGLADVTTERLAGKIDWHATYLNGYTANTGGLLRNRLPMVLADDRAAIAAAMRMCGKPDPATVRVARVKNTLLVAEMEVSTSLLPDAPAAGLEIMGSGRALSFDAELRVR